MWKKQRNLTGSNVSIGENLPKHVQELKKKILIPAMKKARSLDPRNKASVIRNKPIVNGKSSIVGINQIPLWVHLNFSPLHETSSQGPKPNHAHIARMVCL